MYNIKIIYSPQNIAYKKPFQGNSFKNLHSLRQKTTISQKVNAIFKWLDRLNDKYDNFWVKH